jgi:hypothetical protein
MLQRKPGLHRPPDGQHFPRVKHCPFFRLVYIDWSFSGKTESMVASTSKKRGFPQGMLLDHTHARASTQAPDAASSSSGRVRDGCEGVRLLEEGRGKLQLWLGQGWLLRGSAAREGKSTGRGELQLWSGRVGGPAEGRVAINMSKVSGLSSYLTMLAARCNPTVVTPPTHDTTASTNGMLRPDSSTCPTAAAAAAAAAAAGSLTCTPTIASEPTYARRKPAACVGSASNWVDTGSNVVLPPRSPPSWSCAAAAASTCCIASSTLSTAGPAPLAFGRNLRW